MTELLIVKCQYPWSIHFLHWPGKRVKGRCDLADNERLISSVNGGKGSISGVGEMTFLGEINPWESEGSKISASMGLSHISPPQVTGSHLLTTNALILNSDTLSCWDLNFCCNSVSFIRRPLLWFSATWALWLPERRFFSWAQLSGWVNQDNQIHLSP